MHEPVGRAYMVHGKEGGGRRRKREGEEKHVFLQLCFQAKDRPWLFGLLSGVRIAFGWPKAKDNS